MSIRIPFFVKVLIVFIALLSVYAKLQNIEHNLLFYQEPDTDHVLSAFKLNRTLPPDQQTPLGVFRHFQQEPIPKYPLLSTNCYLQLMRFFGTNSQEEPQIKAVKHLRTFRLFHISLYALSVLIIFLFPIQREMKWIAAFLLSTSLIAHQYSGMLRIHMIAGFFNLLSIFSLVLMTKNKLFLTGTLATCFFAGLSMGTFYSGIIGFAAWLFTLLLTFYKKEINWLRLCLSLSFGTSIFLGLLIFFYPSFFDFLIGKTTPFYRDPGYMFSPVGFLGYLNDFFGVDPFWSIGYFFGLWFLLKQKKWKEATWLIIIFVILGYQIFMGFIYDYSVRRASFLIPLTCLVSAFGWMTYLTKKSPIRLTLFIAFGIFSIANVARYNYLTAHDTRVLAYQYIRAHINENEGIIVNEPLNLPPISCNEKGEHDKEYNQLELGVLHESLNFYRENTRFKTLLDHYFQKELSEEFFLDPKNQPQIVQALRTNYYIKNNSVPTYPDSEIIKNAKRIARWAPSPGKSEIETWQHWPPDGNSFYMWKMWLIDYAGPTVEIYQMPWASE